MILDNRYSYALKGRVSRFINTLGIQKNKFCQNVRISPTSFYDWMGGRVELSDEILERIDRYISHYQF